ncbi:MAG: SCO family protein [Aggregatilineales bacterium]
MKNTRTGINPISLMLIGVLSVGIIGLIAFILLSSATPAASDTVSQSDLETGIERKNPAREMPDFTLTDHTGEVVSLSDFAGKPTLISFGFTNCPDICPLTLNDMRRIETVLTENGVGDALNYVFISVDGERDTPEVLNDYLDIRRVQGIVTGLTGSEADVRRMGVDYGLKFNYGAVDENGNYDVDHTAGLFLLDDAGNWITKYPYTTVQINRDAVIEDLQRTIEDT